jgi:hypothetical protein
MPKYAGFSERMKEWCEVAGISEASAEKLANEYGGTRMTFPKSIPAPNHWLSLCIGTDDAQKLASYYAGEHVEIPIGPYTHYKRRNEYIRHLNAQGLTHPQIARICNVHSRTVIRQTKGLSNKKKDETQPDLFPDHHPRPKH